ncbi:hypothetical protein Taro_016737 [Colocasia esculenta]|uniref:Uncharacterized protein n=1 Tax=Colocasia esculenta TaxID=4460 RepID=A0A843UL73_COLES|nr:hypothetical protein [Colocasia esculenta]
MVFVLLAGHFHPRRNKFGFPVRPLPLLPARVLRFGRLDHRVILFFLGLGGFLRPGLSDSSGLLFDRATRGSGTSVSCCSGVLLPHLLKQCEAVGGRNSGDDIAFRQNGLAPIQPDSEIPDKNSLVGLRNSDPGLSAFASQVPRPFHGCGASGNGIHREDSALTSRLAAPSWSQLHFLRRCLLYRGDNSEEVWGADHRREVTEAYRRSQEAVASVVRHHERRFECRVLDHSPSMIRRFIYIEENSNTFDTWLDLGLSKWVGVPPECAHHRGRTPKGTSGGVHHREAHPVVYTTGQWGPLGFSLRWCTPPVVCMAGASGVYHRTVGPTWVFPPVVCTTGGMHGRWCIPPDNGAHLGSPTGGVTTGGMHSR